MSPRHLVVLNWQFPPNQGIGGRRTSILVKHWLMMGYQVSVICQKPPLKSHSEKFWIDGHILDKIEYHFIDKKNNYNSLFFEKGIRSKIKLKLLSTYYKIFGKGNPIDETYFCGETILNVLQAIDAQKKIDFIFTSGAPFYLGYWAARFKKSNPGVKLWCDFRDPWSNAINYGIPELSHQQRKMDQSIHQAIEHTADFISAPYPEILAEFSNAKQRILIPHFHDQTQIQHQESEPSWIYAGEIYEGTLSYWKHAFETASQLPNIQLRIFSRHIEKFSGLNLKTNIQLNSDIGTKIQEELKKCSAIIISLGEHNKDFFTTKFYDHLTYQKPYLYVGPEGKVLDFIRSNGLGERIENWNPNSFDYNRTFSEQLWREHYAGKWAELIMQNLDSHA
jgi:hypothetical protein